MKSAQTSLVVGMMSDMKKSKGIRQICVHKILDGLFRGGIFEEVTFSSLLPEVEEIFLLWETLSLGRATAEWTTSNTWENL